MLVNTVIFDMDGTLLNTLGDLAEAVNYSLRKNGQPERTREEVRNMVGNGVYVLIERALSKGRSNPVFEQALVDFRDYYKAHMLDETMPYEGIMDMLKKLKEAGYKMAIVSNKFDLAVKDLNKRFFAEYIDVAIGEMEAAGIRKKPAPDTVIEAMRQLDSRPEDCVYIGDSEVDLATAANSNIPCISVSWGFKDTDFLLEAGAERIVSNPVELTEEIYKMSR